VSRENKVGIYPSFFDIFAKFCVKKIFVDFSENQLGWDVAKSYGSKFITFSEFIPGGLGLDSFER
jgi:hypothetical protein